MTGQYRFLEPPDVESSKLQQDFASEVLQGLSVSPKAISSKYMYDDEGDRLFQEITRLPEYYLTRCEFEILERQGPEIADCIQAHSLNLVELGAGDGRKTAVLIERLLPNANLQYVPIDICESAMRGLVGRFNGTCPTLRIEGIVADYFDGLKWLANQNGHRNFVLFLGSNIGNFSRSEARSFLRSLWNALNDGDHVLIGFDLKKEIQELQRAYNDSQGVTARFNLNVLGRINRELGGQFDVENFQYHSTYNALSGAVESYLVSCKEQVVPIDSLNRSFSFEAWEPLLTEYSHKFLESEIRSLALEIGFDVIGQFFDEGKRFVDSLWRLSKERASGSAT